MLIYYESIWTARELAEVMWPFFFYLNKRVLQEKTEFTMNKSSLPMEDFTLILMGLDGKIF